MEMSKGESCYHEDTELRLGLPATTKRSFSDVTKSTSGIEERHDDLAPQKKLQAIGWPPIRSCRKNCLKESKSQAEGSTTFVKVSMDGAPYLRKIDLRLYKGYAELLKSLEDMFKFGAGTLVPTYEDKDGDWMLVGDVPWELFFSSCKKLRIMKGSESKGLGCSS